MWMGAWVDGWMCGWAVGVGRRVVGVCLVVGGGWMSGWEVEWVMGVCVHGWVVGWAGVAVACFTNSRSVASAVIMSFGCCPTFDFLVVVRLLSGCDPAVIRLLRPFWTVLVPGCYPAAKPIFFWKFVDDSSTPG